MDLSIIHKIFPLTVNQELLEYDNEGLWSISLPIEADTITSIIKENINSNNKIFDGTGGLGGNVISFSKNFKSVTTCEINEDRFKLLKHNIQIYNLNNIKLINGDCTKNLDEKYDAYFFDPPWGGPDYKYDNRVSLKLGNLDLVQLIDKIREKSNSPIFLKLPNNYNLNEFSKFFYKIYRIKKYLLISIF